jgi:hypothetical protein
VIRCPAGLGRTWRRSTRNVTPPWAAAAFNGVAAAAAMRSRDDDDEGAPATAISRVTATSNDLVAPAAEAAMMSRRRSLVSDPSWIEGLISRFVFVHAAASRAAALAARRRSH